MITKKMKTIIYPELTEKEKGEKEMIKLAEQGNIQAKLDIIMRNQRTLQLLLKEKL